MQAVPVIGGIFSVGCMAMDAANIQASFKQLQTPSQKGEALIEIQNLFTKGTTGNSNSSVGNNGTNNTRNGGGGGGGTKLPNHIEPHVELIQHAMDQLHHSLLLDGDYVELQEGESSSSSEGEEEEGNEAGVFGTEDKEVISVE